MERIPMTLEGYKRLTEELERLIKIERPKNIADISTARAHGDLSENAEYHAAKERQSFIEGRIRELLAKKAAAQIIDTSKLNNNRVAFGAKVKLLNIDTDEEIVYQLLGTDEADVKKGIISITSPVGKSLIGKEKGDEVKVQAPGKTIEYEIMEIIFE